ncbi:uncharacterized protein KY384_005667 [Bacidia gigantensis]|uniref:uncharacterized protein n=1 Tax=Bacidia gigantensis TaxID=2732470 RepID=UPI001D04B4AE|nr:uncharacterized protein KY384_005667 [Bacidia gigantensis]KAG8530184.1 hypothetical protein KY384_005667 [Bacidia gigantensis]
MELRYRRLFYAYAISFALLSIFIGRDFDHDDLVDVQRRRLRTPFVFWAKNDYNATELRLLNHVYRKSPDGIKWFSHTYEPPEESGPHQIELDHSFLSLNPYFIQKQQAIFLEYLSVFQKSEKRIYIPAGDNNVNSRKLQSWDYFKDIRWRAITNWNGWRHARLIVLKRHEIGFSGKAYGYTTGENRIGAIKEDGAEWHYNPSSAAYEFLGFTHLTDANIKNEGSSQFSEIGQFKGLPFIDSIANDLVQRWRKAGIKYDLLSNNCESFGIRLAIHLFEKEIRTFEYPDDTVDRLMQECEALSSKSTLTEVSFNILRSGADTFALVIINTIQLTAAALLHYITASDGMLAVRRRQRADQARKVK